MKKIKFLSIFFVLTIILGLMCGCNNTDVSVFEAVEEIGCEEGVNNSKKYTLDERFLYFSTFDEKASKNTLILNNEYGLTAIYFTAVQGENGEAICQVTEIYVMMDGVYGSIGSGLEEIIEGDLTFTIYVNDDGVVTSDNLPQLTQEFIDENTYSD